MGVRASARGVGGATSASVRARGLEGASAPQGLRGQPAVTGEDSDVAP